MTADEIMAWYESDDDRPIYGYMYGTPWIWTVPGGWERDELETWNKSELKLGKNKDCFIAVWGGPGVDCNIYEFSDYGITWAFAEDEIMTGTKMVQNEDGSWTMVREKEMA